MPDSQAQDQVVRHKNFCRAHPEVTVKFNYDTWQWDATYPGEAGTETIHATELRNILDQLDRHLG
jgi:hypothetical protein